MANELEKNMEHEMETEITWWQYRDYNMTGGVRENGYIGITLVGFLRNAGP